MAEVGEVFVGYTDELVGHLADRMAAADIGRVPVVDRATGKLAGLVARRDLLRVRAHAAPAGARPRPAPDDPGLAEQGGASATRGGKDTALSRAPPSAPRSDHATSSTPTDSRMSPSLMPSEARIAAGSEACVIERRMLDEALDAAQALGEREQLAALQHSARSSRVPRSTAVTIPP